MKAQEYRSAEEAEGLKVGSMAPVFTALDADSSIFSLEEALKDKPVVLIFYRGFWCPVCNKHLSQIQDSLKLIEEKGARVIAVSPEKPEYLGLMAEKTGAAFTLLYDEDYKIADAYDVTFKPSATTLFTYNTLLGAKLKKTHSDDSQRLPIPATYLIDKNGVISWRQFDPDYKKRSNVADILQALTEIQE
ncbi:MAG: peroxiredoxin-like family protein [Bacteroidales bacterium]|nr:peroxiredoxin-like family protein [Bacteroidales bacterium]